MQPVAIAALMCGRISIGIGKVEVLGQGEEPEASGDEPGAGGRSVMKGDQTMGGLPATAEIVIRNVT